MINASKNVMTLLYNKKEHLFARDLGICRKKGNKEDRVEAMAN